jgi:hypothetical protein
MGTSGRSKPRQRQFYKGEVQIPRGACRKNSLGELRGRLLSLRAEHPDDDIEFGRAGREGLKTIAGIVAQTPGKFQRGGAALDQPAGKVAAGGEWEKLLCGP